MSNQTEQIQAAFEQSLVYAGMVDIDNSLFFMLGLFLLFAVLLYILVMKPLIAAQQERHAGTGGAREGAGQIELAIAQQRKSYEQRLGTAKKDAVSIRESLKEAANKSSAANIAESRATADAHHAEQMTEIAAAAKTARAELASQSDTLASAVVAKLLGDK